MRPSRRDIVIATRKGALAMVQSRGIGEQLSRLNPHVSMRLVSLVSDADRIPDRPLASMGGKGLFTRTIEQAVLDGRADIAVHSLKDQPVEPTPGLVTVAIPPRAAVHDVLIAAGATAIEHVPLGATFGTCSPRRRAQLLRLRPDIEVVPLRGNVQTRMRRVLEERKLDATFLAAAGLQRLGLEEDVAVHPVPLDQVLPAAGQGALAIQCRVDDHTTIRRCMALNDPATSMLVHAERQIVGALGADCHSPVAVLAEQVDGVRCRLRARVLSPDGARCIEVDRTAPLRRLTALARESARKLLDQGAAGLLVEAARAEAGLPEG